jgi:hypothetical protein
VRSTSSTAVFQLSGRVGATPWRTLKQREEESRRAVEDAEQAVCDAEAHAIEADREAAEARRDLAELEVDSGVGGLQLDKLASVTSQPSDTGIRGYRAQAAQATPIITEAVGPQEAVRSAVRSPPSLSSVPSFHPTRVKKPPPPDPAMVFQHLTWAGATRDDGEGGDVRGDVRDVHHEDAEDDGASSSSSSSSSDPGESEFDGAELEGKEKNEAEAESQFSENKKEEEEERDEERKEETNAEQIEGNQVQNRVQALREKREARAQAKIGKARARRHLPPKPPKVSNPKTRGIHDHHKKGAPMHAMEPGGLTAADKLRLELLQKILLQNDNPDRLRANDHAADPERADDHAGVAGNLEGQEKTEAESSPDGLHPEQALHEADELHAPHHKHHQVHHK